MDNAPTPQEQPSLDAKVMTCSWPKERKREMLHIVVPESDKQTDLAGSPCKARIRALKLLPGSGSALNKSTSSMPEGVQKGPRASQSFRWRELNAQVTAMPRIPL